MDEIFDFLWHAAKHVIMVFGLFSMFIVIMILAGEIECGCQKAEEIDAENVQEVLHL